MQHVREPLTPTSPPLGHLSPDDASAYLAAIIQSSDDAILSKDLNGIIQSCNPSAERLFGYSSAELIGQPVRLLIPADRQSEEDDILARIRRGERIEHFETIRQRKDGQLLDISLTVSPVRNAKGDIVGISKIARDITERRRAEQAMAEQREGFERERQATAAEREHLLRAERLARSEAEKASRLKDDFVAMVSHELRTPLNAILGWTQLMSQPGVDAQVLERGLDIVARNTRMQAQLIADLLDVSRIVAGKLQLEVQPVDLRALLHDALDAVQRDAEQQGLILTQKIDDDLPAVSGDAARLQQVIWNLLSNAIKFTPAGGRIDVGLSHGGDTLELSVADTGVGIAADVLPHIFERFQQADRSITRRFGGLGLGLSIVKHLTDLHGGTIDVESPGPGLGATFRLRFPVPAAAALDGTPSTISGARRTPHPVSLDGTRVLVVEDEPDTREFLVRLLANHGASVATAASAHEAVARARADRPDVVVTDIGLPDVDGYDLLRMIRELFPHDAPVPAIALTAYARSEDRARALAAGFQRHLSKPIHAADLVAAIATIRRAGGSA